MCNFQYISVKNANLIAGRQARTTTHTQKKKQISTKFRSTTTDWQVKLGAEIEKWKLKLCDIMLLFEIRVYKK